MRCDGHQRSFDITVCLPQLPQPLTCFQTFSSNNLVVRCGRAQKLSQGLSTIFCLFQFWFDPYFNEWKWFLQLFDKIMNRPAVFFNACMLGIFGKNAEIPTWHHIPRANWFLSCTFTRVWHNTRWDDRAGKWKDNYLSWTTPIQKNV